MAPGFGIHVTVGLKAWVLPVFWPLSAISLVPSNPGDYTPRIMMTGGINHAGVLRPATPFYPDGLWGYLKGNGVRDSDPTCLKPLWS